MASVNWIIASPPPIPTLVATVKTEKWSLTSETTQNEVELLVFHRSLLTLVCIAGYPIKWIGENQTNLPQTISADPLRKAKKGQKDFTAGPITVTDQYSSILIIHNFTETNAGTYICQARTIKREDLKTIVHLMLRLPNTETISGAIIQTGFNVLRPQPGRQFRYTSMEISNSMVYSIPSNSTVIASVLMAGDSNSMQQTVDLSAEPHLLRFECLNDTGPTTMRKDTAFIPSQISIECRPLSHGFGQIIFTSSSSERQNDFDVYLFELETTFHNGTSSIESIAFVTRTNSILEYRVNNAEILTPFDSATFLTIGQLYEIRMYTSNFILPQASFFVWPLIWSPEFRQRFTATEAKPEDCDPVGYPYFISTKLCGVVGVSLFNDSFGSVHEIGIRITMNVTTACLLQVKLPNETDIEFSQFNQDDLANIQMERDLNPNYTPNQYFTSSFGQIGSKMEAALSIAALEPNIFGYEQEGAKLILKESNIYGTKLGPNVENDFVVYSNESVTLRCLIPQCYRFLLYPLCPNTCDFISPKFKANADLMADVHTGSIQEISLNTLAVDNYFRSVTKNHSALYACMLLKPSQRRQQYIQLPNDKLKLTVRDPIPPLFSGPEPSVVTKSLKPGSIASLVCKATADPPPEIRWRNMDGNEDYMNLTSQDTLYVSQVGTYVCNATSKYGSVSRTFLVQYESEKSYLPLAIGMPVAIVIGGIVTLVVWWLRRRAIQASFKELAESLLKSSESVPLDESTFLNDQVHFLQYNRNLEINRNQFTVTSKLLGLGEFGSIYKGELKLNDSGTKEVAVKVPKNSFNLQQFSALADELKIMSHIRPHVNVLSLIGACTQDLEKKQLFVLTEFCDNGSLKDYLMKNCMKFEGFDVNAYGQFVGSPGAVEVLLKYAYQSANGMAYLAAEKIIHRDLALRNLLLSANHIVKISDFGMSRQNVTTVYRKRLSPDIPMPIFWMAIEALVNGQFTVKSDVWSFGIVLWEMFSCGRRPYPDHKPDAAFLSWLRQRGENRLRPPNIACDEIFQLMLLCWKVNADARPTFSECKRIISRILEERSPSMYQSMVVTLSDAWLAVSPMATPNRHGSSCMLTEVESYHVPTDIHADSPSSADGIPLKEIGVKESEDIHVQESLESRYAENPSIEYNTISQIPAAVPYKTVVSH